MSEHYWKFKVGSKRFDHYRATTAMGAPCVQVLADDEWIHWTGEPVAGEMLRLAVELHEAQVTLADLALKERDLRALAENLEGKGQQVRPLSRAKIAERIRSILRLPE